MLTLRRALVVLAAVVAIFATTPLGKRLAVGIGLRDHVAGAAPSGDVEFLLERCGGDRAEALRRVAAERERFPALGEAEHYRRAIRRLLAESPSDLSIPASGEVDSSTARRAAPPPRTR